MSFSLDNTLRLRAFAREVVEINQEYRIFDFEKYGEPWMILGEGSNVVLPEYYDGIVLLMRTKGISIANETCDYVDLNVQAGELWTDLVEFTLSRGWFDLENLAMIPGTVGAAPIQNIGAYGASLSDVILSCQVWDPKENKRIILSKEMCVFGYRDSLFKRLDYKHWIICSITIRLSKKSKPNIDYVRLKNYFSGHAIGSITSKQIYNAVVDIRSKRLPDWRHLGTVGSLFINPLVSAACYQRLSRRFSGAVHGQEMVDGTFKLFAGNLLHLCGWRGYRYQGVIASSINPMVLINQAPFEHTQDSFLLLVRRMVSSVKNQLGIDLVVEPSIIAPVASRPVQSVVGTSQYMAATV